MKTLAKETKSVYEVNTNDPAVIDMLLNEAKSGKRMSIEDAYSKNTDFINNLGK